MASVSFTFNLDPAVSAAKQNSTAPAATESNAAIGAKYDSVQTSVQGTSHLSGLDSPACVSGDCFVVHGEGPGVTTLSIGEEDGGSGDYITLPVVDGSLFLEPPLSGVVGGAEAVGGGEVVGAGEYDVTTLAIGEEDGGLAAAPPEIGVDPAFVSGPIEQAGASQVAAAPLGPIETTPIITPVAKPTSVAATPESVQIATAASPLPPIQTVPIIEPRAKPAELASTSFPLPEIKPDGIGGAGGSAVASADGISGENLVSVGDYDAYLESMTEGGSGTAVAGSTSTPTAQPVASAIYAPPPLPPLEGFDLSPLNTNTASIIYSPPPLAPIEPFNLPPVSADEVTISYRPPPLAPIEPFDFAAPSTGTPSIVYSSPPPAPVFGSIGPVETAPLAAASPTPAIGALETSAAPRIKPASFMTPGPATLPPIQTVPIQTEVPLPVQAPVAQTTTISSDAIFGTTPGSSAFVVEGPIPPGKPEGVEAPRLSDDDFRISTLALGEEEAGGG